MTLLYLIRHPHTRPDPAVPASQWRLSEQGTEQVRRLVALPMWADVTAVYTSRETKTMAVGEAVQAAHGLPFTALEALGEARREGWLGVEAFEAAQQAFFARPDEPPAPGWESAYEAQARFVAAVGGILQQHPLHESLAVVSHATVLALGVAYLFGVLPTYESWRTIGFADVLSFDRATLRPASAWFTSPGDEAPY